MQFILIVLLTFFTAAFFSPIFILFPFTTLSQNILMWWGLKVAKWAKAEVIVTGLSHIDLSKNYIICCNHQSQLDIPFLFGRIPLPLRMAAKKELFWIPIFGWCLSGLGFVKIDRTNRYKAVKSLDRVVESVASGRSILFFPEGTRSADGKLLKFSGGMFQVAIKSGVQILPVVISGSNKVHNKKNLFKINKFQKVIISVMKPVDVIDYDVKDRTLLLNNVRDIMEKEYSSINQFSV